MEEWNEKYSGLIPCASVTYPEENFIEFYTEGKYKLSTYRYPAPEPKAQVYLIHGMHGTALVLTHIAKRLAESNCEILAFDQKGHGKSQGPRGKIRSLQNYVKDQVRFIEATHKKDLPVFLVGESMGGAISVLVSLEIPNIQGIILLAPALGVNPDFEPFLRKIVKILAKCCPGLPLKEMDPSLMSRNPYNADFLRECPYIYSGRMDAGTGAAMLRGLESLQTRFGEVTTPILVFQGGRDEVCSPDIVKRFIKEVPASDKTLIFNEDLYHIVTNEPEFPEYLELMTDWISQRVSNTL